MDSLLRLRSQGIAKHPIISNEQKAHAIQREHSTSVLDDFYNIGDIGKQESKVDVTKCPYISCLLLLLHKHSVLEFYIKLYRVVISEELATRLRN